jgi:hypothetical protein
MSRLLFESTQVEAVPTPRVATTLLVEPSMTETLLLDCREVAVEPERE